MRRVLTILTAGSLAVALSAPAWAAEKKVESKDLPPAVQRTVQEISKGAELRALTMEVEGGATTYEAELEVNGHGKDVSIDASGAVVEVEEEIALDRLPAAARDAIRRAAGKGAIVKVESITHGDSIVAYEAQVRTGGKRSEVRVAPDGSPAPED